MRKRGLSAIIATILIILIVVFGVAIVWGVILPFFSDLDLYNPQDTSLRVISGGYTAYSQVGEVLYVQVSQKGSVSRLEIIVVNDGTSHTFNFSEVPGDNNRRTYRIDLSGIFENLSDTVYVKAVPYYVDKSKEKIGTLSGEVKVPSSTISGEQGSECFGNQDFSVCSAGHCLAGMCFDISHAWTLNESDGPFPDLVGGYAIDSGTKSSVSQTSGIRGNAQRFEGGKVNSGSNDYICLDGEGSCGNKNSDFDIGFDKRSVSLWFKTDSSSKEQMIYQEGGSSNGMNLFVKDGKVHAGTWTVSAGLWISGDISSNQWYHVVEVFDSNDKLYLYINGTLVDSIEPLASVSVHTGADALGWTGGSSRLSNTDSAGSKMYFDGVIDEVIFFDEALDAGAVSTIYASYS